MSKRSKVDDRRLAELESEFNALLRPCLEQCAHGRRYGLFGHNDHIDIDKYADGQLRWEEAARLLELATEIQAHRAEFGGSNPACERLLHYHSLRGSNVPGEPRLAEALLKELFRT